jgi:steroid delta-isomerase-like uncharacterized protein
MATADAPAVSPDAAFIGDWSAAFLDAWNELDGEAVASLCTEDVVWSDPMAPEPLIGRVAVREFVEMTARAFPDFHVVQTAPLSVLPGRVLSPYRMTGTMLGPIDVFAPTERRLAVAGVDDWTFRGELLCRYSTYYDTLDAARQLRIMPGSGTRTERIMVLLQHAQARFQRRLSKAA